MPTLYRAADDDYIAQGYSFAESIETARVYLDNTGFGGGSLYSVEATGEVLDLRGMTVAAVADRFDRMDPGAIGVDEWIPRTQAVLDQAQAEGYSWILVDESYPAGTTTWIWCGDSCDEPDVTEITD